MSLTPQAAFGISRQQRRASERAALKPTLYPKQAQAAKYLAESRIAILGEPDDKTKAYHKALHNGVIAAFEAIRPGVRASEVYEAAMNATRKSGIPHYSRSHVGHGIGLDGYDMPDLIPGNDQIIEEGMVMCVETPYYEFGWCGLQVENTVVVRRNGPGDGVAIAARSRR